MAVKASVDTSNQTTVRVGQQNATKVTTTQTGIASAVNATTAANVVGGRADVTQLAVSGLSTFTGIGTFVSDLYVGGDLYLTDDLVLDNISGSSLDISGISSVGFLTATDVHVSGAVTATSFYGDGSNLVGTGDTTNIVTNSLVVSGISTLGITSATDLEAQQLSVSGISTFNEDVVFTGANTNARWDHSTSDLILFDNTRLEFGSNKDFEIWHGGSHTFMKNSGGDLRIRGDIIKLAREDGSERYLEANVNNEVKLFFNGDEKFETTKEGVLVSGGTTTGTLSVTGVSTFVGAVGFGTTSTYVDDAAIYFGDDNDLQIFHSGSHSWIEDTGTGNLVLKGSRIDIQDTSGNELLSAEGGQYVRLGYGATERLKTTDVGVAVSGIVTATSGIVTYYGDGTNLTGVARTDNINTDSLYVSGISTFAGIATVTGNTLFTKQLSVSGVTTFNQDVNFPGAAYNIHWDQPTSKFKFDDSAQCVFGSASGGDLKIFHQSGNSSIRNETGQFRIAGNDIRLQTQNHSEDYLLAVDGGSVSIFYNDVKRLETSGIGITVTGITSTTDLYVTGLSTYIGVATYKSDVFVDGTLTAGAIDGGTY